MKTTDVNDVSGVLEYIAMLDLTVKEQAATIEAQKAEIERLNGLLPSKYFGQRQARALYFERVAEFNPIHDSNLINHNSKDPYNYQLLHNEICHWVMLEANKRYGTKFRIPSEIIPKLDFRTGVTYSLPDGRVFTYKGKTSHSFGPAPFAVALLPK